MSIATEITRIQTAKSDIKTQIEAKGVTVPSSASLSDYPTYVSQIQGGGGTAEADLINLIEKDITSITIPSGATKIGDYALYYCSKLTSVTIPNNVTSIGASAFRGCSKLTSITIPDNVTSIGEYAFSNCTGLTSITIPNSVTSLEQYTFGYCSALTSITIPDSVTNIGKYALYYCSKLTSVTVEATTPPTLGTNAFNGTNNCPILVPAESVEAYKAATNWSTYADRIQAIPA